VWRTGLGKGYRPVVVRWSTRWMTRGLQSIDVMKPTNKGTLTMNVAIFVYESEDMHWWRRLQVNLKWRYASTSLHGVTFQNTVISTSTSVQTANFEHLVNLSGTVVTLRTTVQSSLYVPQFSGHYTYHSSVVTICTTVQWPL